MIDATRIILIKRQKSRIVNIIVCHTITLGLTSSIQCDASIHTWFFSQDFETSFLPIFTSCVKLSNNQRFKFVRLQQDAQNETLTNANLPASCITLSVFTHRINHSKKPNISSARPTFGFSLSSSMKSD
jgi:hypothetical protein